MDNLHSFSKRLAAAAAALVMALCGGTFTALAADEGTGTSVNMSLLAGGSVIGMKFTIDTPEDIKELSVTVDKKAIKPDSSGSFTIPEYSMNMADKHEIVIKKGDETLCESSASVAKYLDTLKGNKTYGTLASDMLLYGGYSMDYFGVEGDDIDKGIDPDKFLPENIEGSAFDKDSFNDVLKDSPVSYYGMNLSLKERTTLTVFFKKAEGFTQEEAVEYIGGFTFGGSEVDAAANGESFVSVSATVPASKLSETIEFTNGDVSADFSPLQYIVAAQGSGNDKLAAVCKALYAYGVAVNEVPEEPEEEPQWLLEPKGKVHSGLATQYDITQFGEGENNLGQAMLRDVMEDKDLYAAISTEDYNNGMLAGAYIEITYNGNTAKAQVIDTFGGDDHDSSGNVDVSAKVFEQFDSEADGDINVDWKIIPYPKDKIKYRFKNNRYNAYYFEVQVYDQKYPIYSVELKQGNDWIKIDRTEYNYFFLGQGDWPGPYTFRLTDIYGHVIVDENVDLSTGTATGSVQFPD